MFNECMQIEGWMIPWRLRYFLRCVRNVRDWRSALRFVTRRDLPASRLVRLRYVRDIYRISRHVWCAHTEEEILEVATAVLKTPADVRGVIVEAGCYKGGSTAKLSLVAKLVRRKLLAYDSFEGLPQNDEAHRRSIFGEIANFEGGRYRGGLEEVQHTIERFGDPTSCTLIKGWFSETMPSHNDPIVVAFLDVDLVESTRDCLKFLFPHLQPGQVIFSQDGHLPLIVEALNDDMFWRLGVGRNKPRMTGLNEKKLVQLFNR
jgi:O-methyltransferase